MVKRILLLLMLTWASLFAVDINDQLRISAFANADATISNKNNAYVKLPTGGRVYFEEDKANFDYSLIGAQIDWEINEYFDIMAQGVYSYDANEDKYKDSLEWALLGINLSNNYKLRLGKMRVPFMKYTETQYIGYTYLWTRPQLISGVNGFDTLYGGSLEKRTYINDVDISLQVTFGEAEHEEQPDENDWLYALSAEVSYDGSWLRLAYGQSKFDHYSPRGTLLQEDVYLTFGSIETALHFDDLGIYGGFGINNNPEIPVQKFYYASLSYSFGNFTPYYLHAYDEVTDIPNPELPSGPPSGPPSPPPRDGLDSTTKNAIGMRYDAFDGVAIKLEAAQEQYENNIKRLTVDIPEKANVFTLSVDMVF